MALTYVGEAHGKSKGAGGGGGKGGGGGQGGPGGKRGGAARTGKKKAGPGSTASSGRRGSLVPSGPAAAVGPAASGAGTIAAEAESRMQRLQRARASVMRRDQHKPSGGVAPGAINRSSVRSGVSAGGVSSSASASTDRAKAFRNCCRAVFLFLFTQVLRSLLACRSLMTSFTADCQLTDNVFHGRSAWEAWLCSTR